MIRAKLIFILTICTLSLHAQQIFEWTEQNSGVSENLRDVYFLNSNTGWAVGDNGTILFTSNGGVTWSTQTSGVTDQVRAVHALDELTAYVVGGVSDKIMLKTTDAGTTWESFDPNNNISHNQIIDVHFTSTANGWVITNDSVFYTTNGGESWENEKYINGISQTSHKRITATSDTTAFIASRRKRSTNANPFADVIWRLKSNDLPWVYSSSSAFSSTDYGLNSIEFADFNNGFAGGSGGILYKAEDLDPGDLSGPWKVNLDLSSTNTGSIWSISFPTSTIGLFSIGKAIDETNYTLVYHTSNQGDTWHSQPDSISDLLSARVHSPEAFVAWAVGSFGKVFKGAPSATGIGQTNSTLDVNVYPNPASDKINVEINSLDNEPVSYSISDLSGRTIKNGQLGSAMSNSTFSIDISDMYNGSYLLTIISKDNQGTIRILKK